jgi:hypothetical protein
MLKCGFFVLGTESDCTIGYVKCGNQVDCIYAGLICDGTQQCPDGSDEDKEICTQGKYCVFITGFLTRLTRRVPLVEQELLILPDHMSSPPVFGGVRVTRSLALCVVDRCFSFCTFFYWPLCFLIFFDIRIIITPLVSSNFSNK